MKRILSAILLGLVSIISVNASHIESMDLTYRWMGGNNYQIQLCFYRDCSGVPEPSSVTIYFKSSCGNFSSVLPKQPPLNGIELTPVCPGTQTTCSGGALFGFEKFLYVGTVTLTPCADWTMSYSLCCRNPSNTIQSPTSTSIYIPAILNNAAVNNNSSAYFTDIPTAVICHGQPTCIYFGCEDMDGDSLAYRLITPWDDGPGGASPNVIYLTGYSALQPLPSSPPVTMNSYTGEVCMTPTTNLVTVFAVQVDEYRKVGGVAVKVGSIIRDIQLAVITCTNSVPALAGINPSATQYSPNDTIYQDTVCVGNYYAFNVYSYDADHPSDILTMNYINILYGPTWSVSNNITANPVGHFTWTPSYIDTNNNPHCFFVKISDDNCPYLGYRAYCYCLTVIPPTVAATFAFHQDTLCSNDPPYLLMASPPGGVFSGPGVYGNHFYPDSAGAGTHTVTYNYFINGSCALPVTDQVTVINSVPVVLSASDTAFCIYDPPGNLTGSPPGGTFSGPGVSGNLFDPTTAGSGTHKILYTFIPGNACVANTADSLYMTVGSAPVISISGLNPGYCLYDAPATLTGNPSGGIFSGPGIAGNQFYPSAAGQGTHYISYTYTDGMNCTFQDSTGVSVFYTPVSSSGLLTAYCLTSPPSTLSGNPSGGTFSGTGITGNLFDPAMAGSGNHTVIYSFTDGNGCTFHDTVYTEVSAAIPVSIVGLAPDYCINDAALQLLGNPGGGTFYGTGMNGSSFNPLAAGSGTHMIVYSYAVDTNCVFNDTAYTTVGTYTTVALSGLAADYCINDAVVQLSGSPSGGTYVGPGMAGSGFDPGLAGSGNHMIVYSVDDGYGCVFRDTAYTTVGLATAVSIAGLDSMYCTYSPPVTISGVPSGGIFNGAGMSGALFDPSLAGAGTHTITYSWSDTLNCTFTSDEIVVVGLCVGVKEFGDEGVISIYPNPFTSELFIMANVAGTIRVSLHNVMGQEIYRNEGLPDAGKPLLMDMQTIRAGIYLLTISTEDAVYISRAVKAQ